MTDESVPAIELVAETVVADAADAVTPSVSAAEPPKVDNTQKRIDELTWRNAELRRQLAAKDKPAETPVAPKPLGLPPTLEQYEFDQGKFQEAQQKYLDALVDQRVSERLSKAEQEKQVHTREQTFQQRQAEFAKKTPEYVEKVIQGAERGEWACSEAMAELIQDSEMGPALAMHLATNPEVAASIAQLPPIAAAREMGRLEAKLEKPVVATPVPPKVSQAPPPPAKIEATEPDVRKSIDDPAITDAEFAKIRRRQIAQRR